MPTMVAGNPWYAPIGIVRSPTRRSNSVAVLHSPRLRADESGLARYARTRATIARLSVAVVSMPQLTLTVGEGSCARAGKTAARASGIAALMNSLPTTCVFTDLPTVQGRMFESFVAPVSLAPESNTVLTTAQIGARWLPAIRAPAPSIAPRGRGRSSNVPPPGPTGTRSPRKCGEPRRGRCSSRA